MKICRRDVVNAIFGDGTPENHLVIVLSPDEVNEEEYGFLGVMISDSPYYDKNNDFSFPLNDSMFTKPLDSKQSRVRLYLMSFISYECVDKRICQMNKEPFEKLIKDINTKIFGV